MSCQGVSIVHAFLLAELDITSHDLHEAKEEADRSRRIKNITNLGDRA